MRGNSSFKYSGPTYKYSGKTCKIFFQLQTMYTFLRIFTPSFGVFHFLSPSVEASRKRACRFADTFAILE